MDNKTPPAINNDPDRLLKEEEAATLLGVTRRALQNWRFTGSGPRFIQISPRCIRYRKKEILEWTDKHLRNSTSDKGQEAVGCA